MRGWHRTGTECSSRACMGVAQRHTGSERGPATTAQPQRTQRTSKRRADSDTPIDSSKSRAPASSRSASLCSRTGAYTDVGSTPHTTPEARQHSCHSRHSMSPSRCSTPLRGNRAGGQHMASQACAPACWLPAAGSTPAGPQPPPAPAPPPPAQGWVGLAHIQPHVRSGSVHGLTGCRARARSAPPSC